MSEVNLKEKKVADLREIAKALGLSKVSALKKQELIDAIMSAAPSGSRKVTAAGSEKAADSSEGKQDSGKKQQGQGANRRKNIVARKKSDSADGKSDSGADSRNGRNADSKSDRSADNRSGRDADGKSDRSADSRNVRSADSKGDRSADSRNGRNADSKSDRSANRRVGRVVDRRNGRSRANAEGELSDREKKLAEEEQQKMLDQQRQENAGMLIPGETEQDQADRLNQELQTDQAKKHAQELQADQSGFDGSGNDSSKSEENNRDGSKDNNKKDDGNKYDVEGILELADGGFGFLRFDNFLTSERDVYVAHTQIRRFNLRTGDKISGIARKPREGEKFGALIYVNAVNGDEPGAAIRRPHFENLTPIFPNERIKLEEGDRDISMRLIDLVAPIGKGQRGLIVAPPKAGKTTLLKKIANSIERMHPEIQMIILLVDERPEEVTDMKRSLSDRTDVIYSTFDEMPQHHAKVAEMVLARAQRLAEHKKDVIILLDSITRLARAYNLVIPASGRTLSGGLDPGALHKPKKFFGAARNIEEGGSITILATALIETGSKMDDVIFEEFKGTGNMELHLDRKLSERRIFPAVSLNKSGTRKEDLLMDPEELQAVWAMRRAMANAGTQEVTESIIDNLVHTRSNADFLDIINKIGI